MTSKTSKKKNSQKSVHSGEIDINFFNMQQVPMTPYTQNAKFL